MILPNIKKALVVARASYRRRLAYRAGIPALMVLYALGFALTFVFWKFIYSRGPDVADFGFRDTISYLVIAALTRTFINSDLDIRLGAKIHQGTILSDLLLPVNPLLISVSESLGTSFYMFAWGALPVAALAIPLFGVALPKWSSVPAFLVLLLLSMVLNVYINYLTGVLAIWTRRLTGVLAIKGFLTTVLSGTLIPLHFLPPALAKIAILSPFSLLSYTPIMAYLGKLSGASFYGAVANGIAWILVLHLVTLWANRYVQRKFMVYGG
jgi:ABC-type uncharacterized transport system permease subunit